MQIYSELKSDHEKIKKLLDKIESTSERAIKTRPELLSELKTLVLSHSKAEETAFYQSLLDEEETHEQALEALEEHRLAAELIEELEEVDPANEKWLAKFKVFRENLEHHIEEEEDELFKQSRKIISRADADEMGEIFIDLKKEVMDELRVT